MEESKDFELEPSSPGSSSRIGRIHELRGMRYLKGGTLVPLMRGVIHKWNNLLGVVSAHAQIALEGVGTQEERREDARLLLEIVEETERINQLISAVLHLPEGDPLGTWTHESPHGEEIVCVGTVLRDLWEILLCEKQGLRYPVQIKAPPHCYTSLPRAALLISLTWGIEALLEGLPSSAPGTIEIKVEESVPGPKVRIGFHREEDHLPFPTSTLQFPKPFHHFLRQMGILSKSFPRGFQFFLPPPPKEGERGKPLDLPEPPANL